MLAETLNRAFEITNYKHKNTGAGSISEGPSRPLKPSKHDPDIVVQGLYYDYSLFWLHQHLESGLTALIRVDVNFNFSIYDAIKLKHEDAS